MLYKYNGNSKKALGRGGGIDTIPCPLRLTKTWVCLRRGWGGVGVVKDLPTRASELACVQALQLSCSLSFQLKKKN